MSQVYYYSHPGGWVVNLGDQAARLGDHGGYSIKAETGTIGTSTFIIDDPAGTVGHAGDAILGLQQLTTYELDCAAVGADGVNGKVIYPGYIRERTYRRGTSSRTSLITGVSREIEMTLEDPNSVAAFRILNTASAALPGTATKTSGNTTVSGSGTNWLTSLGPNFTISIPGGGGTDVLYVDHVVSDTSLVVITAPTHSASGQTVTRIDANRPAETDVQRVQWLLSGFIAFGGISPYLLVTNDAGWIDTSGGVNMDANDYTGQNPADVIHDCALASGKDWWIGYWEATGRLSLWYANSNTSTTYSSLLRLSNVLADVDNTTTFAPMPDDALLRSPVRTFAGVWFPYAAGHLYVSNATTASNYAWRDGSAPNANVKTLSAATAAANRLLAQDAIEEDRITCRVQLPSTLATGIKAGQRIQGKFSHLPGYADFTWMRVASLQIAQDEPTDQRYTLTLELTPQTVSTSVLVAVISAGETNATEPTDLSAHAWTKLPWQYNIANASQFPGPGGPGGISIWYRAIVAGEGAGVLTVQGQASDQTAAWVYELGGVSSGAFISPTTVYGIDTLNPAASASSLVSATAVGNSVLFGTFALQKVNYGEVTQVTTTAGTRLFQGNGQNTDSTGGTCGVTVDAYPPFVWTGYATGSGSLSVGGTVSCTGASPDYNLMGRGRVGIVLPLSGTFSVVQSAFGGNGLGGSFTVTLPAPP